MYKVIATDLWLRVQSPSTIYFFYSMLMKLFVHSKIGTIRTNDYFNETFCRQEEGL